MRVLMVCLGNICRSPLAEGILLHKVRQYGLDWVVDSAGTSGWHAGEQPDRRSMAIAKKYGIDISQQRGRKFDGYDFERFDLIYVMDKANYEDVMALADTPEEQAKVRMILNEINPGKNQEVPDPYYNDNGFEEVYAMLDKACETIVQQYLQLTDNQQVRQQ